MITQDAVLREHGCGDVLDRNKISGCILVLTQTSLQSTRGPSVCMFFLRHFFSLVSPNKDDLIE